MYKRIYEKHISLHYYIIIVLIILPTLVFGKYTDGNLYKNSIYIIQIKGDSIINYKGGIEGLMATAPIVNRSKKLNLYSMPVTAYKSYLTDVQTKVISTIQSNINRQLNIVAQYKTTFNGIAAYLTPDEALILKKMPYIVSVKPEFIRYPQTHSSPTWIGAHKIWDNIKGIKNKGEGIIIGIIDTGINPFSPSFDDESDDGYKLTNRTGKFFGVCNPANESTFDPEFLCTNKLIGAYDMTSTENPLDEYNHGSHAASIAAGNVVNEAQIETPSGYQLTSKISGVAPHANIVSYKACNKFGCPGSALIAAIEQAVNDGVDIINYSISGTALNPWEDGDAHAFLAAQKAGIFVAASAGNLGSKPGSIGSPADAPWLTAVGASTHDIAYLTSVINLNGGNTLPPKQLDGRGLSNGTQQLDEDYDIVYAGDYGDRFCEGKFVDKFDDKMIVVCDRGKNSRTKKGENVKKNGGAALIIVEVNKNGGIGGTLTEANSIPSVHLPYVAGKELKDWLATGSNHKGRISPTKMDVNIEYADIMGEFSSRGPSTSVLSIIKPDLTAPGVGILAASNKGVLNSILSGTSMSSPHVAGAAALLKVIHPDWTADEIRSALMTTSITKNILKDDGYSLADPFDIGSGRLNLKNAANAGLVLNETYQNYILANPMTGGDPHNLNIPSLGDGQSILNTTWKRILKNPSNEKMTWVAESFSDKSLPITIIPQKFTIAPNDSKEIQINVNVSNFAFDQWVFGDIKFQEIDHKAPQAHLPIAVLPKTSNFNGLTHVIQSIDTTGSTQIESLKAIEIKNCKINVHGLVKGNRVPMVLNLDPIKYNPFDTFSKSEDGANLITVDVPEGARRILTQVVETTSLDIDIYMGKGHTPSRDTLIANSSGGGSEEMIELKNPENGIYWILVQNCQTKQIVDEVEIVTVVIPDESNNNLLVTGPLPNDDSKPINLHPKTWPALKPFNLSLLWDLQQIEKGDMYYGTVTLGSEEETPEDLGEIAVKITNY